MGTGAEMRSGTGREVRQIAGAAIQAIERLVDLGDLGGRLGLGPLDLVHALGEARKLGACAAVRAFDDRRAPP